MNDYWNTRFGSGGKVWGINPSGTAINAKKFFEEKNIDDVLVIGSGYGRHSNYFHKEGFSVEGIEYSEEGIKIAIEDNPKIKYYHGSVFDMPFREEKYSSIYCFNVIHLFTKDMRNELLKKCKEVLKDNGVMYFTSFSEQEGSYGTGEEIEENTFETKKDKPIHFYTEEDIRDEFKEYIIVESGLYSDIENHGDEGEHEHLLRYIVVQKK